MSEGRKGSILREPVEIVGRVGRVTVEGMDFGQNVRISTSGGNEGVVVAACQAKTLAVALEKAAERWNIPQSPGQGILSDGDIVRLANGAVVGPLASYEKDGHKIYFPSRGVMLQTTRGKGTALTPLWDENGSFINCDHPDLDIEEVVSHGTRYGR